MAELTGQPGFAPPKKQQTGSRRRQATTIELIATATLTVSLVVAATAVSMGNKLLTRGDMLEKTTVHVPQPRLYGSLSKQRDLRQRVRQPVD